MQKILTFLFLIIAFTLSSCSDDDEKKPEPCLATNVTMVVNGELQSFQAQGRGIDAMQDGYRLSINLDRRSNDPYREQTIYIILPYKKTGQNIIQEFHYRQYINGVAFEGDFLDGTFECNIITNRNTCFYATFSGKLNDGNQEIIITGGKLSYQYETPFDN